MLKIRKMGHSGWTRNLPSLTGCLGKLFSRRDVHFKMGVFLANSTQSLARCRECSLAGWLSMQVPRHRLRIFMTSSFPSSSWFVRTRQWQYLDHRDNDKGKGSASEKNSCYTEITLISTEVSGCLRSKQSFAAWKKGLEGTKYFHSLSLLLSGSTQRNVRLASPSSVPYSPLSALFSPSFPL